LDVTFRNVRVEMASVKCAEFLQELTNYLDGVLDQKDQGRIGEPSLLVAITVTWFCDTTKKTIEIYRDSNFTKLPEDLRSRLRSAIMTKCQQHKKGGPHSV